MSWSARGGLDGPDGPGGPGGPDGPFGPGGPDGACGPCGCQLLRDGGVLGLVFDDFPKRPG